ncbi:MAG: threonylcarbamoyl-AMP synthase [Legionellales bacterium]|nr:threonylcarbamoyl-AMP synthase [Legionellales bacterium]
MLNQTEAIDTLKKGGIIAYPTEAVFGLGCDPDNLASVTRLLSIKKRPSNKGLILIAASWEQLQPYLKFPTDAQLKTLMRSWPGPVTWLVPARDTVSALVKGEHTTLAVRITAHPIARELCQQFNKPLISTSANYLSEPPCRSAEEVAEVFKNEIDYIVQGETNSLARPTEIRDLLSGKIVRG